MIFTFAITLLSESLVVLGYCRWRQKPVRSILATSICANLLTQLILWALLRLFFQQYIMVLGIAEILIWIMESIALYSVPANRLRWTDALLLSLFMNLMSFALGWFLPI